MGSGTQKQKDKFRALAGYKKPEPSIRGKKPLTDDELEILEEIDGYDRLMLNQTVESYCSNCHVKALLWKTGYEIEQIMKPLFKRGLLARYCRKYVYVTDKGIALIKRKKVFHFSDRDGNKFDGQNNPCTKEKPCEDCIRVKSIV